MSGKKIKRLLDDEELTQKWLMNQLRLRGINVEYTRLSHILNEQIKSEGCQHIIDTSAGIVDEYKKNWSIL